MFTLEFGDAEKLLKSAKEFLLADMATLHLMRNASLKATDFNDQQNLEIEDIKKRYKWNEYRINLSEHCRDLLERPEKHAWRILDELKRSVRDPN